MFIDRGANCNMFRERVIFEEKDKNPPTLKGQWILDPNGELCSRRRNPRRPAGGEFE